MVYELVSDRRERVLPKLRESREVIAYSAISSQTHLVSHNELSGKFNRKL